MRNLLFDPPKAGCMFQWPGLPGGGSRLYDRSPHGNNGSITGAAWNRLPGGLWQLAFDGVDDRVQCPDSRSLDAVDDLTILLWVKRASLNRRDIMVAKREGGSGYTAFQLDVCNDGGHQDQLNFICQSSTGAWESSKYSQGTIDTGWHQVAVTRSPQKIRFFIDGKLDPAEYTPAVDPMTTNTHVLSIGGLGALGYFAGSLALVRIYKYVLGPLEIRHLFDEEKGFFGGW